MIKGTYNLFCNDFKKYLICCKREPGPFIVDYESKANIPEQSIERVNASLNISLVTVIRLATH